ncbi:phosphatase PAP2 family protein [Candidatus Paracaedibacter symbiosus]|uniref:phosphatase PAP2 family protein n=1 Tax=Candidatus Paracaedibacter symbiosus TaxID=244582 RepID=UPI000509466F|nr:phosphatase PAP2 family protein [Candidatus Paracaedibacter symbiosus]
MDQLCGFFLLFSKEIVLIPIFLIGYFFYNRNVFFQALVLLLFSLVAAAFLKSLFKIPLLPHLGEGWAFPSGHMFTATVFWGFLALKLRNKFITALVIILLAGIGYSLMHFHYHNLIDIVGAVGFAILLIIFYRILLDQTSLGQHTAALSLSMLTLSVLLIYLTPPFKPIFYIPLGTLTGLTLGSFLAEFHPFKKRIPLLVEVILCFAGLVLIYLLSPFLANTILSCQFVLYFLIGIWLTFGPKLLNTVVRL